MKPETTIYPPFYALTSDILKIALDCTDARTVRKYLLDAGVKINHLGNKEIVTHENLMKAINHSLLDIDRSNIEISDTFKEFE